MSEDLMGFLAFCGALVWIFLALAVVGAICFGVVEWWQSRSRWKTCSQCGGTGRLHKTERDYA